MKLAAVQISPVWLEREATLARVASAIKEAADVGADLAVVSGEVTVPGYPFWLQVFFKNLNLGHT